MFKKTEQILNFEQAIFKADKKKHLLLGNGFSVSLFPDIFSYKNLSEKITNEEIKLLFDKLETRDFEYVMSRMTKALQIIEVYDDCSSEVKAKLSGDIEKLKTILIDTIADCHPENPSEITDAQYDHCCKFLHYFEGGKKYTLNYDLLLYWVYMHCRESKCDNGCTLRCDDGFRTCKSKNILKWEIGNEHNQNLYYLHGAMHVFSDGSNVEKYNWCNRNKTLVEQVKESIEKDKYPVFISEGTTKHKKMRINNNSYLGSGFSSLKSIEGSLFIHGHSLRNEDDHIFNCINDNKEVKKIFVSIHGEENSEANRKIIKKINKWRYKYSSKEYFVYTAETAKVWG